MILKEFEGILGGRDEFAASNSKNIIAHPYSSKVLGPGETIRKSGSPGRERVERFSGTRWRGESAKRAPPDHWC